MGKKGFLSKKSKEELVQEKEVKLEIMTKEVENLELLVNIINIIVCHYEIPRFKYEKMNNYFSCLKQAVKAEFENHEFVRHFLCK